MENGRKKAKSNEMLQKEAKSNKILQKEAILQREREREREGEGAWTLYIVEQLFCQPARK